MKKLLYIFLLLIGAGASAQQAPVIVSNPYNFLKWVKVDTMHARIIIIGAGDTAATQAYVRSWVSGGLSLIGGFGIRISGDSIILDTAQNRKMDSLYVVTDSTFIIKINGTPTAFKMRGAVLSFNGRIGPVVPQATDYSAFYPSLSSAYFDPAWITGLNFSKIVFLPNTLGGYGILDGMLNLGGGRGWGSGSFTSMPEDVSYGNFYYANDTAAFYWADGTKWNKIFSPTSGGSGNLTGTLTPGTILYAQTASKVGSAPIVNDTTDGRININVPLYVNDLSYSRLSNGNTAQRPGSPQPGYLRFNTDSASYEQYTGSVWQKLAIPTTGSSGTVTDILVGLGLSPTGHITSTGSIKVDTTVIIPWIDTTISIVTRTFARNNYYPITGNPSGYITGITGSMVTTALGFNPVARSVTATVGFIPYWKNSAGLGNTGLQWDTVNTQLLSTVPFVFTAPGMDITSNIANGKTAGFLYQGTSNVSVFNPFESSVDVEAVADIVQNLHTSTSGNGGSAGLQLITAYSGGDAYIQYQNHNSGSNKWLTGLTSRFTLPNMYWVGFGPNASFLSSAGKLGLDSAGNLYLPKYAGGGTVYLTANNSGVVGTSAIPTPFDTTHLNGRVDSVVTALGGKVNTSTTIQVGSQVFDLSASRVFLSNVLDQVQVINAGGGKSMASGTYASRPSAGNAGAFYFATDSAYWTYDNGTSWSKITERVGKTDSFKIAYNGSVHLIYPDATGKILYDGGFNPAIGNVAFQKNADSSVSAYVGNVVKPFTKTSHGFAVGTAITINSSGIPIKADTTTFAVAVVSKVIDANNFEATFNGSFTWSSHGLTIGSYYYVTMPAGTLSSTSPNESQPVLFVADANTVIVNVMRPHNFAASAGLTSVPPLDSVLAHGNTSLRSMTVGTFNASSVTSSGGVSGTTGTYSGLMQSATAKITTMTAGSNTDSAVTKDAAGNLHYKAAQFIDMTGATAGYIPYWNGTNFALEVNAGGTGSPYPIDSVLRIGNVTARALTVGTFNASSVISSGGVSGTTGSFSGAITGASSTVSGLMQSATAKITTMTAGSVTDSAVTKDGSGNLHYKSAQFIDMTGAASGYIPFYNGSNFALEATLPIAQGGLGTTAISGFVFGTGSAYRAATGSDYPTFNQNTTGTAGNVTGTVAVANGGTNITSYTIGDILYASASGVLSKLADVATTNVMLSGGVGAAPSYGKVNLGTMTTGTAAVGNGGTGLTSFTTGDLLYASSSSVIAKLADIATGNVLITGGVGVAPSYGKVDLTAMVSGALPLANGGLGTGAITGSLWGTGSAYRAATSGDAFPGTALNVTGTVAIGNGGTNLTGYTLGDLLYSSATNTLAKLAGNTTTTKKYLNQTGTGSVSAAPAWSAIADADIAFTDITTGNATSLAHGYLPKLSGNSTDFFHGDGTYSALGVLALSNGALGVDYSGSASATIGTAAGSGASATLGANSSRLAGTFSITTGSTGLTANGILVTIGTASFGHAAIGIISPLNNAAAALSGTQAVTVQSGNNYITINAGSAALAASTSYTWNYIILGF